MRIIVKQGRNEEHNARKAADRARDGDTIIVSSSSLAAKVLSWVREKFVFVEVNADLTKAS